jgi:hypothetical protein
VVRPAAPLRRGGDAATTDANERDDARSAPCRQLGRSRRRPTSQRRPLLTASSLALTAVVRGRDRLAHGGAARLGTTRTGHGRRTAPTGRRCRRAVTEWAGSCDGLPAPAALPLPGTGGSDGPLLGTARGPRRQRGPRPRAAGRRRRCALLRRPRTALLPAFLPADSLVPGVAWRSVAPCRSPGGLLPQPLPLGPAAGDLVEGGPAPGVLDVPIGR